MISSSADCSPIRRLSESLQQNKDIALHLIEFKIADTEPKNALCQLGLSNEKDAITLLKIEEDSASYNNALDDIIDIWITDYENWKSRLNHKQRRKRLEDIIRLLNPIEKDADARLLFFLPKPIFTEDCFTDLKDGQLRQERLRR